MITGLVKEILEGWGLGTVGKSDLGAVGMVGRSELKGAGEVILKRTGELSRE